MDTPIEDKKTTRHTKAGEKKQGRGPGADSMDSTSVDPKKWYSFKDCVIYRKHPTRKYGRGPDRYLALRYTTPDGKEFASLGWTSEGWTTDMALELIREFRHNIKLGIRPWTLKEKREMAETGRKHAELLQERAKRLKITFGELADLYIAWAKKNRVSGDDLGSLMDNHIPQDFKDRLASSITALDVAALKEELEAKRPKSGRRRSDPAARLSASTVMHVLKLVREVYNFAAETPVAGDPGVMLYSGPNPARMSKRSRVLRPPQADSRRLRILNDREIKELLRLKSQNARQMADIVDAILLSLDTGPRAGELGHLRKESVDAERGTVRYIKGSEANRSTKSGKARIVHAGQLYPECIAMLRRRVTMYPESPYLFPGADGSVRDKSSWSKIMRRIADRLGFNEGVEDDRNRVVWNTLRHTFATRMLEDGCDVYMLKELMGHESVTTTEHYLHLCDRTKRETALAKKAIKRNAKRLKALTD